MEDTLVMAGPGGNDQAIQQEPSIKENTLVVEGPGGRLTEGFDDSFDYTDPSNYSKALEGLGLATGATGEIRPELKETLGDNWMGRTANIAGSLVEGGINAARETGANALDMVGGMVPGAQGLWDTADNLREPIPENSIGKLMGDMATGGVAGKAAQLLGKTAVMGTRSKYAKRLDNLAEQPAPGRQATQNYNTEYNLPKSRVTASGTKTPTPVNLKMISETISKLSPTTAKFIDRNWDKLMAPVSRNAAIKTQDEFLNKLIVDGYSSGAASKVLNDLIDSGYTGSFKNAANTKLDTGTAIGALLGSQKDD